MFTALQQFRNAGLAVTRQSNANRDEFRRRADAWFNRVPERDPANARVVGNGIILGLIIAGFLLALIVGAVGAIPFSVALNTVPLGVATVLMLGGRPVEAAGVLALTALLVLLLGTGTPSNDHEGWSEQTKFHLPVLAVFAVIWLTELKHGNGTANLAMFVIAGLAVLTVAFADVEIFHIGLWTISFAAMAVSILFTLLMVLPARILARLLSARLMGWLQSKPRDILGAGLVLLSSLMLYAVITVGYKGTKTLFVGGIDRVQLALVVTLFFLSAVWFLFVPQGKSQAELEMEKYEAWAEEEFHKEYNRAHLEALAMEAERQDEEAMRDEALRMDAEIVATRARKAAYEALSEHDKIVGLLVAHQLTNTQQANSVFNPDGTAFNERVTVRLFGLTLAMLATHNVTPNEIHNEVMEKRFEAAAQAASARP